MSFDIHCLAFQKGEPGVGDSEAARRVITRAKEQKAEFDGSQIQFSDGSHVELYAGGLTGGDELFDGGMFVLHGGSWSSSVMEFIRDFAAAGRLAIFPQHPLQVILPFQELLTELPSGLTQDFELFVVATGDELRVALIGDERESATSEF